MLWFLLGILQQLLASLDTIWTVEGKHFPMSIVTFFNIVLFGGVITESAIQKNLYILIIYGLGGVIGTNLGVVIARENSRRKNIKPVYKNVGLGWKGKKYVGKDGEIHYLGEDL